MLTQREIADWRRHVVWPRPYQIEHDLLLTRAVEAIFADQYLARQVAMRGGTVLHKVHLAPPGRFSEDIDLVAIGDGKPGAIARAIWRVIEPIFGRRPDRNVPAEIQLNIRNLGSRALGRSEVRRLEWRYTTTGGDIPEATLKIEVNVTERTPVFSTVRLPFTPASGLAPVQVVSYDINEMLGTKLRALRQREKARDLYDLAYAWEVCTRPEHPHPISAEAVANAFLQYMQREGTTISRQNFENDLARKVRSGAFAGDLHDVLRDPATYDMKRAAEVVREAYLAHLP